MLRYYNIKEGGGGDERIEGEGRGGGGVISGGLVGFLTTSYPFNHF